MVEQLADDRPEDGVTEEFKPLVGGQAVFGPGRMRQRGPQQPLVGKRVVDPLFASLKQRGELQIGVVRGILGHGQTAGGKRVLPRPRFISLTIAPT